MLLPLPLAILALLVTLTSASLASIDTSQIDPAAINHALGYPFTPDLALDHAHATDHLSPRTADYPPDTKWTVFLCSKPYFKGNCSSVATTPGLCSLWPSWLAHDAQDASFGPQMNLQCALYQHDNCGGDSNPQLTWPGTALKGGDGSIRKLAWWGAPKSFKCRTCWGCINGKAPNW